MINTQTLLLPRAFAFAARDAARRLAPSRLKQQRRRNSWRSAVLRWRRRTTPVVNVASVQVVRPAVLGPFSQVHVHLTPHFSGRIGNDRHATTASIHHTRLLLQHIGSGIRAVAPVQQFPRTSNPCRAHAIRMTFQLRAHGWPSTVLAGSTPTAMDPNAFWTAARLKPLLVGCGVEGFCAKQATREPQQRRLEPTSMRHISLHVVRSRGRNWAGYSSQRELPKRDLPTPSLCAKELPRHYPPRLATVIAKQRGPEANPEQPRVYKSERVRSQLDAPETLVWRRGTRLPVAASETETYPKRTDSHRSQEGRALATQPKAPAVSPTTAQPPIVHPAKLDASLMDRLTDDVIRRVEQRIRIERQRRGL